MPPPSSSPVDIVYLWVNGNDLGWRQKRQRAALQASVADHGAMALYGNVEGRFRDNDELRYSLRALERYFPEHGHVYVVTDGQTPAWLRASSLITVVDHRDLIPAERLPIFDSGNIESYIHRIPGLSERFFYFNDDVFFGAPVQLDDWFWEHGVYAAWSDDPAVTGAAMQSDATSLENGSRLSKQWLDQDANALQWVSGYAHTPRTFAHSPRPLLKSLMYQLEREAAGLFEAVRSTVFRNWATPTIVSDFVLRWALAHGVARLRDYSHLYVTTTRPRSCRLCGLRMARSTFSASTTPPTMPMPATPVWRTRAPPCRPCWGHRHAWSATFAARRWLLPRIWTTPEAGSVRFG